MKCVICGSLLTEDNAVVKLIDENLEYNPTILCWYCEEDAKEPSPYDDIDCHPDYDPKTDSIQR